MFHYTDSQISYALGTNAAAFITKTFPD